jgi:hypothetical protein
MFGGDLRHANLLINSYLFWGVLWNGRGSSQRPPFCEQNLFWESSDIFPFEKIMVEGMLKKSYRIRRKPCPENQRSIKKGLESCVSKQEMAI